MTVEYLGNSYSIFIGTSYSEFCVIHTVILCNSVSEIWVIPTVNIVILTVKYWGNSYQGIQCSYNIFMTIHDSEYNIFMIIHDNEYNIFMIIHDSESGEYSDS